MTGDFASAGRLRWGWFLALALALLLLPLVADTHTATLLAIWALLLVAAYVDISKPEFGVSP